MPTLDNVMYNYMDCVQMMIGPKVKYCVTYKNGQRSFNIFRARFQHDFMLNVNDRNFEGAKAIEFETMGTFIVAREDTACIFDSDNYKELGHLDITLLKSEEREPNEILAMQKCQNEEYLAVITGKNLIMNQQKFNQLYIFRREKVHGEKDTFKQIDRIVLKENPIFDRVCKEFHFVEQPGIERTAMIFANQNEVFELDIRSHQVHTRYKYINPLNLQPANFDVNDNQNIMVVASADDGLYINVKDQKEVDIDELFGIGLIKNIAFESETREFYVLANRSGVKLGFYMLRFHETDIYKFKFVINYANKLDMGDATIYVNYRDNGCREMIIGYKSIYINIYTIVVMDLTATESDTTVIFSHESFQLWESGIFGLFLKSKDFITVNRDGLKVTHLGSTTRKAIKDNKGNDKMLHSLESMNSLKIDSENNLKYSCQKHEKREV